MELNWRKGIERMDFAKALRSATLHVVIVDPAFQVFERIWCLMEMELRHQNGKVTRFKANLGRTNKELVGRNIDSRNADAFDPTDKAKFQQHIPKVVRPHGYDS